MDFVFKINVLKYFLVWDINFYNLYNYMLYIGRFVEVDVFGKLFCMYEDLIGMVIGVVIIVVLYGEFVFVGGL